MASSSRCKGIYKFLPLLLAILFTDGAWAAYELNTFLLIISVIGFSMVEKCLFSLRVTAFYAARKEFLCCIKQKFVLHEIFFRAA